MESLKECLISKIDSLINQYNDTLNSGFSNHLRSHDIYFREGYLYSLNEWKKSIQFVQDASSELTDNYLDHTASLINRGSHIIRKGASPTSNNAIKGRRVASETVLQVILLLIKQR